ncbi:outer membrane lipoprotein carrier protein LolA [Brumimicrobium aurantiacum]|uniref:Outer membrane lipoprotein carrier protein LolA n=1 Tax=Brumimicrobium aurantiacum TaxID=1737063 RepID=A0A3E1EZC0_9FLAO|nr:outer membrane lipoprotein carrier protein LolA [Brumimicrobium aurantiacum]RFC54919.1 outer membrane lipoprotein carrier protein LolA [Brumimicrobium aurantiacum]
MKPVLLLFIFISLNIYAQEVPLTETELKAFTTRIETETKKLTSLTTDFEQQKHLAFLSNDIQSYGKMFLRADGALKWSYTEPNKYSVIFKNNAIYINDNGKKSTVSGDQDMFKKINHLIAGSVSGKLFNDNDFSIRYFKVDNEIKVKLIPDNKTLKKYLTEVHLYFPQNEALVSKVKLIEPSGDYTLILFKNKKLNVKIDPNIFKH